MDTPILERFYEREFGAEFFSWEWSLIKEFEESIKRELDCIRGFVSVVRGDTIILTPLPWITQVSLICKVERGINVPWHGLYIEAYGRWHRIIGERLLSEKLFIIDGWKMAKFELPKPTFSYRDAVESFLCNWENIPSKVSEMIFLSMVSSPHLTEFHVPGGMSLTIYPFRYRWKIASQLLSDLKRSFPPFKGKGKIAILDRVYVIDYSVKFIKREASKLTDRHLKILSKDLYSRHEVSLGIYACNPSPKTVDEPSLSLSDNVVFITFDVKRHALELNPGLVEYVLLSHFLRPVIKGDSRRVVEEIRGKVLSLVESFDLPSIVIGGSKILNLSYKGKPASILRDAVAYARAKFVEKVDGFFIRRFYRRYYEPMLIETLTFTEDLIGTLRVVGDVRGLGAVERRVIRVIDELGEATLEQICEKIRDIKPYTLKGILDELYRKGFIYEPEVGKYRVVPLK